MHSPCLGFSLVFQPSPAPRVRQFYIQWKQLLTAFRSDPGKRDPDFQPKDS
jgi:hypothetical protein